MTQIVCKMSMDRNTLSSHVLLLFSGDSLPRRYSYLAHQHSRSGCRCSCHANHRRWLPDGLGNVRVQLEGTVRGTETNQLRGMTWITEYSRGILQGVGVDYHSSQRWPNKRTLPVCFALLKVASLVLGYSETMQPALPWLVEIRQLTN